MPRHPRAGLNLLRCCFITAELAPLVKAGGLADAAGALSTALHRRGVDLQMFLPLYAELDRSGLELEAVPGLEALGLELGTHRYSYSIVRARRGPDWPDVLLVDCPALFSRPGIYGDAPDEHRRFALLCRAALDTCARQHFAPQVVHCHDWHTALVPTYLQQLRGTVAPFSESRSLLTIHNLGYQGILPASAAGELGLSAGTDLLVAGDPSAGHINLLGLGLRDADRVSTVSPTYAAEICTPELGMGLDGVLLARGEPVVGIMNGVDYAAWDPATDRHLPHHYSAADLSGKARLRAALCAKLGLDPDPRRLLIGMVSRLVWQKGIDLVAEPLAEALERGRVTLVALGSGEPANEALLESLARQYPRHAAFRQGHDEPLAHWIEAGSDAFLMPSRYEPCGLNQLYSLKYGTVPIVRHTGGLADSVTHFNPATGQGTGIVFNDPDPNAVRWALDTAVAWHADEPLWQRLLTNGMAEDFSWDRQVDRYLELYAELADSG
jgi:starch synthase